MRKTKAIPRPGWSNNVVPLYSDNAEVAAPWPEPKPKPKRSLTWLWGITAGLAGITVGWAVATHGASLAPYGASLASEGASLVSNAASMIQSIQRSEPVALAIIPPAPVPPPIPPKPVIDTVETIRRGEALIADGKILEARVLFEKAALSGDPEGALRLGATYDPDFLKKAQSKIPAQPSEAEFWYGVAKKVQKVLDAPD